MAAGTKRSRWPAARSRSPNSMSSPAAPANASSKPPAAASRLRAISRLPVRRYGRSPAGVHGRKPKNAVRLSLIVQKSVCGNVTAPPTTGCAAVAWASSCASASGAATQSASTNHSSSPALWATPMLRAAAAETGVAVGINRTVGGRRPRPSWPTTMISPSWLQAVCAWSARITRSITGELRAGIMTLIIGGYSWLGTGRGASAAGCRARLLKAARASRASQAAPKASRTAAQGWSGKK